MSKTALEKIAELKLKRMKATQKFFKRTLWYILGVIAGVGIIGLPVTLGGIYVNEMLKFGTFLHWATSTCIFILGVAVIVGIISFIIEICPENKKEGE